MEDKEQLLHEPLYQPTPLLRSLPVSELSGHEVWFKLENAQNSGSYKIRGIGLLCQRLVEEGCKHLVSSSGGNAGIAAAYSALILKVPCTVVVPEPTQPFMIEKIKKLATNVVIHGQAWDDANKKALEIISSDPTAKLVHPFDHPHIWEGHSTMVDEIMNQLHGKKPDVVVMPVGGGGLLCGVLQGMHKHNLTQVPVVCMEPEGAPSFNVCFTSHTHTQIEKANTIAKTLAVKRVCKRAVDWITEHDKMFSCLASDKQGVEASLQFADHHRFLVSVSSGIGMSALYSGVINSLQKEGKLPGGQLRVVVIVTGGNEVTLEEVGRWKGLFGL